MSARWLTLLVLVLLVATFTPPSKAQKTNDELIDVIELREKTISDLAEAAEKIYAERPKHVARCTCSTHSCSNELGENAKCFNRLGTLPECGKCSGSMLDYTGSAVRLAPGADPTNLTAQVKETICTFKALDSEFAEQGRDLWTYLGSIDGTFRIAPVRHKSRDPERGEPNFQNCQSFDPRVRPWYISASTGPKDVVLLLDTSGSMSGPLESPRWDLTRKAIDALLDTFTFHDYVNIVTFNSEAGKLVDSKEGPLLAGTDFNKEVLRGALPDVFVDGGTDFNTGFQAAFDLLEDAGKEGPTVTSSGCSRIIIFLTDGKDCSTREDAGICSLGDDKGPEALLENIEKRQVALEELSGSRAAIFTYSMGADADDSLPRQIACANDGTWSFLEDGDDPLLKLNSYYTFLAAARYPGEVTWAEPYVDADGLGTITTVSKTIYSPPGKNGTGGVQIGVVGLDVDLDVLEVTGASSDVILATLAKTKCVSAKLEPCRLQVQRETSVDHATCPDRLPKKKCYEFLRRWYRSFNTDVTREEAQAECKKMKGDLVSIRSKDHLSFIASMSSPKGSWLGAKKVRFSLNHETVWEDESVPSIDETSDFWGVGEPQDDAPEGEECVIIDPRGVSRNMNDVWCESQHPYICEFEDRPKECKGKNTITVDPRSFFEVPPLSECQNEESIVEIVRPVDAAKKLSPEDALCPLGKQKDIEKLVCCDKCPKENDFDKKELRFPLKDA